MGIIGGAVKLRPGKTIIMPSPRFQRRPLPIVSKFIAVLFLISIFIFSVSTLYETLDASAAAPTVTNISPNHGPIAGGTVITVTGNNFKGDYERVEAIIFDGDSYVNTGITQRLHTINARFQMDTSDTSTANVIYGTDSTNTATRMAFAKAAGGSGAYTAYLGGGANYADTKGNTLIRDGLRNDIAQDWAATYHVNGSQLANTGTIPTVNANILIGRDATLNANYRGYYFSLRTYSGTIMNHNFVPVKKVGEDVYGFIDTLEQPSPSSPGYTFYGNSGTGTLTGGTTIDGVFVNGATIPGGVSPDAPVEVLIDGRACTGVNIVSNTELTCHTPSGLSLGKKDLAVRVPIYYDSVAGEYVYESTTVTDGFEYALRLNSISPKYGDPAGGETIEIEGGVFSTPPEQYESVEGIVFDGDSWIETGFNQVGSTKFVVNYRYASSVPNGPNVGFFGSRAGGTGSNSSFVVWSAVSGTSLRSDYNSATGGTSYAISNMPSTNSYTLVKDNNVTTIYDDTAGTQKWTQTTGSGIIANTSPAEMLLGSLSHGGAYGTNGATAYRSFFGTIYSAQICKDPTNTIAVPEGTIYQVNDDICGSGRVLVRDLRPSRRDTDGAYGFYDMVTGEFIANAGFGTFTSSGTHVENALEVPLELTTEFSYEEDNTTKTGVCSNPTLVSPTKISCVMPPSPFSGGGSGKVDLTVYANDVEATPGTADADDFYYGSPMIIDTISPNRGPISGGQLVTITGNNFFPDDDPSSHDPTYSWQDIIITVGGSPCNFRSSGGLLTDPSDYTNTSLTCVTTANSGGISDIEVTSTYFSAIENDYITKHYLYGGSIDPITGAITSGYLYEDQLISISPATGPTVGGTTITIRGNNFLTNDATTRVFLGTAAATNVVVVNSTTITARTPAQPVGSVDVLVSQNGYAASLDRAAPGAFSYYFSGGSGTLSPNRGYISGGESVLITGSGFDPNTTATVTVGGTPATDVVVLDANQIRFTTPAHATGIVDVVITQYSIPSTIYGAFEYILPLSISTITPNKGSTSGGTEVTITGTNLIPAEGTAETTFANLRVTIGSVPCIVDRLLDFTNTFIICTTTAHARGLADVAIEFYSEDPDYDHTNRSGTLLGGFEYLDLSLSLSANSVTLTPAPTTIDADDVIVSVQTSNPTGYTLSLRADDADDMTSGDNWLKCTNQGSTAKFESVAALGPLFDNTWGWNVGNTQPTDWRPVPTANTAILSPVTHPTGPLEDGTAPDEHHLWYAAKTSWAQPIDCSYEARIVITVVAR